MRCLNCKYDLTHLTVHRCPECGREFDPANKRTFVTTRQLKSLRIANIVVGIVFIALFAQVFFTNYDIVARADPAADTTSIIVRAAARSALTIGPVVLFYVANMFIIHHLGLRQAKRVKQ